MSSPVIGGASKALSTGIRIFLKIKKKNTHPHKVYANIIFACPHQNTIENDGNMISDVFMMYYIIVFETSVFIRPHANKRLVFSKTSTLESIFKKMRFR